MRKVFVCFALVVLALPTCKRRSQNEIQQSKNDPASADGTEANLDKLKLERNALISELESQKVEGAKRVAELTLERDELTTQRNAVESDITRLQKELETASTAEQKADVQLRLTTALRDRDDLNTKLQVNADTIRDLLKKMDNLSEEIRKANGKINDLNSRIEVLEKELAVERSKVETVNTVNFPKSDASTSAAKTAGAATPTPTTSPSANPSPSPSPSTSPTATPATPGTVSAVAWQFYRKNVDASLSCFEFGSTVANASLLGVPCVTPAPIRQQFKTETFGSQFLIVDQRTQMCVRLDSAATTPATARIVLGACKRGGDVDELWNFFAVDTDTGSFQFKSVKTGNCLHIGDDKKVVQVACGQASTLFSVP